MHGMGARQHEKARPIGEKRQVSWVSIPSVRDDVLLGFQEITASARGVAYVGTAFVFDTAFHWRARRVGRVLAVVADDAFHWRVATRFFILGAPQCFAASSQAPFTRSRAG
ncbi:hypothetical protein [Xanthomonas euvesicatoria]|uniref:hypothetical protein n=1 Tax=Xanthomonas euvesicatoria TaxID=456327 RepID=UPI001C44E7E5|nr:hypothetical protein [Xanthomonas euvesicatoria]